MSKPAVIEEKEMSMSDVKEEIDKIKKRDEELNFRMQKTEEYINTFLTLKPSEAKKLKEKIEKLKIPRLKQAHICKIIDIRPATVEMLKLVLQGYTITISNDNMKKITAVVHEFLPKKK